MIGRGLYLPNGAFMEFGSNPNREALLSEISTRETAQGFDLLGWMGMLPDPDPILRKRMEWEDVLDDLTADDQVTMAMQSRKLKTLNKTDYDFAPGKPKGKDATPEAERICAALVEDLEAADIYNLVSEILDAPYFGRTVVELLWEPAGSRLRLVGVVPKPRAWFGYNTKNELSFRALGIADGEPVPFGKFVTARHFPTYANPYGLRLLSRCLWPVAFKKGSIKFWMNFAERFGTPWVVGKTSGTPDDQGKMLASLTAMVQSAVAVVRGGAEVQIVEASGKSGDVHAQLLATWNAAISKVLMGQTLTAEVGTSGSYAAAKEHGNVLADYAEADEALVTTFMNDLAWVYTQVNAGDGVYSPMWSYVEPEDYAAKADLDNKLKSAGVKFKKAHFVSGYGLAEDEFDVEGDAAEPQPAAPPQAGDHAAANFADADGPDIPPSQQAIDAFADGLLPEAEALAHGLAADLVAQMVRAESQDDALLLLADALAMPEGDGLEDLLHRSLVGASLYGQWAVGQGGEFADAVTPTALPMKEAQAYWQGKTAVTTDEFAALDRQARARAFTVAGMARRDQVEAVQSSLTKALAGGRGFEGWRKDNAALLAETGLPRWRLETIFRTNVQSAYMAGRYAQMQRVAKTRPYWRYVAVGDRRTRPEHLALHGLVYPADHSFWDSYYPPNGFRCRCTVQTLSERDVARRGYTVESELPKLIEPVDPRTGERMPPVRPAPDPGFGTNVGRDWLSGLSPEALEGSVGEVAAKALCRDGKGLFADERCKPPLADLDPRHIHVVKPGDLLPATMSVEDQVLAFLKEFGLSDLGASKVVTLPGRIPVVVSKGFFIEKSSGLWKTTWTDKGPYMKLLARTILNPFEVWQVTAMLPSGPTPSLRLLRPFSFDGGKTIGGYCAFHLAGRQWQAATAFAPKADRSQKAILEYLEKMRGGVLIYREEHA
ncbi:MAG: DUF935 family protein [Desulfovibrionaceae bacterium]